MIPKKVTLNFFLFFFLLFCLCKVSGSRLLAEGTEQVVQIDNLMSQYGVYGLAESDYMVELSINGMGGYLDLTVKDRKDGSILLENVADVSGVSWVDPNILIITTSPIYGKPGLLKFLADKKKLVWIVKPRHKTIAYPDGTDGFKLYKTNSQTKEIYYYYADDGNKVDWSTWLTPKYLRCVDLKGQSCYP